MIFKSKVDQTESMKENWVLRKLESFQYKEIMWLCLNMCIAILHYLTIHPM